MMHNEDGDFLCEEHKPERKPGQWMVDASEIQTKCDLCKKKAVWYVLEAEECKN